jgi:hypothetical protein
VERLHCRIPAAVGLLSVGFWRRVGGSAVFPAVFFFIFLVKTAFLLTLDFIHSLSISANFNHFWSNIARNIF